jgi:hypothetical protein
VKRLKATLKRRFPGLVSSLMRHTRALNVNNKGIHP